MRNIRRHLANMHPVQAMKVLLEAIRKHPNNESFLKAMIPQQPQPLVRR